MPERERAVLVRHLGYFVALARERHFARAAEACNITQPTLSAAIRKLEEDLAAQLVVRNHRYVGLTAEGETVLRWSRRILVDYDSLVGELAVSRTGALTGVLRLGVIPAAMPSVAFLTARFCKAHPGATVEIHSMTSRAIQEGLDTFDLDAGITYLDNEPLERVERVPLYRERYVFVAGRAHPFAGRASVTWAEAAGEALCLLSEDMQNRRILDRVALSVGAEIRPAVVSNSFLGVCAHLRQGSWAGIVPHTFFYVFGVAPDLVAVDLVDPVHSQSIGLVLSDREPRSPMSDAVLAALLDADFKREFAMRTPA